MASATASKEFLQEVVQNGDLSSDVQVVDFTIAAPSMGSWLNVVADVKIGGKDTTKHLIIKRLDNDEPNFMNAYVILAKLFEKESYFHSHVLPALEELSPAHTPRIQKLYKSNIDWPHAYVAVENSAKSGFKLGDKKKGLSFDECSLAVTELAKLHALSYVLSQQKGQDLATLFPLVEYIFPTLDDKEIYHKMYEMPYRKTMSMLESSNKSRHQELAGRMKKFIGQEYDIINVERTYKERKWNVINHGEMCNQLNNVVFTYEGDKPTSTMMIEFQGVQIALPTIDLGFFIFTSTTAAFRRQHLDQLLSIYHTTFETILKAFSITDCFSRSDLDAMWRDTLSFHFIFSCFAHPMMFVEMPEQNNPPPQQSTGEKTHRSIYKYTTDELVKLHSEGCIGFFEFLYDTALQLGTFASDRVIEVVEEMAEAGII